MMISIDFKFKSEPPSPPAEINEYTRVKYLPKHRWLRYVASKNDPNSVVEDG